MAVKKTETEEQAVKTEEQAVKTAELDPWHDMREITLPRPRAGEAKSVPVWVNGHAWQVPKGQKVEVPYPIWERLTIMLAAEAEAEAEMEAIPNEG